MFTIDVINNAIDYFLVKLKCFKKKKEEKSIFTNYNKGKKKGQYNGKIPHNKI